MKKIELLGAAFLIFTTAIFVSCKEKTHEEILLKAQSIYDKKGMNGFEKYLKKNDYVPVKDNVQNSATPFLIATKNSDLESMNLFIQKGANPTETDGNGHNGIDYALNTESSEVINFVISQMPNEYWKNKDENGLLPCIKFINKCTDFAILQNVLNLTDNFSFADKNGKTLLMYAAQNNTDVRVTKFLLDNDITLLDKKNENEWTALMYASRYNPNPAVMEDLLLRGEDSNPNSVGLTVTMLASCNPNPGVLFTLFKYKDEVNAVTSQGKTALMYACENKQDSSVIKMLIDNGANVNAKDNDGKSALIYAIEYYDKADAVYVLISAGAETETFDNGGKTPLDYLNGNTSLKSTDLKNALGVAKGKSTDFDEANENISGSETDESEQPDSGAEEPVSNPANDENAENNENSQGMTMGDTASDLN